MIENKNNSDNRDHARGSAAYIADQQRGADERIGGVIESLDNRLAQLEKGVSCLNLARDLLFDWVYRNTVIHKDDKPNPPEEIDIAMQLIKLVISDLELNHDITADDKRELNYIMDMVQKMDQDIQRYEDEAAYIESGMPLVLEEKE